MRTGRRKYITFKGSSNNPPRYIMRKTCKEKSALWLREVDLTESENSACFHKTNGA
jgi:hypothetical protein